MLCDECKMNEAVYRSVKVVNGRRTEKYLCESCQKLYGGLEFLKFGLGDFFSTLTDAEPREAKRQQVCGNCGQTLDNFLQTGMLGCAKCYSEFGAVLKPIILKTQGRTQHMGKVPKNADGEYERLKAMLRRAVDEERFEDAYKLKNQIKELDENRDKTPDGNRGKEPDGGGHNNE
jgi:protein arginine kinase activator